MGYYSIVVWVGLKVFFSGCGFLAGKDENFSQVRPMPKAILIITEYTEVIEIIYDTVVNYSLQKL